jgi:hypothetical protein
MSDPNMDQAAVKKEQADAIDAEVPGTPDTETAMGTVAPDGSVRVDDEEHPQHIDPDTGLSVDELS